MAGYKQYREEWKELYDSGWTQPEIAEEYGCSEPTVSIHLRAIGVKGRYFRDPEERFWNNVEKGGEDECWEWQGALSQGGYGKIKINGKHWRAHRYAYKLAASEPGERIVCHHCDNPSCVNPNHLYAGSHKDNAEDRVDRGRQARGEEHKVSKLSREQVLHARALYRGYEKTFVELAEMFGVTYEAIQYAVRGQTWKHLPGAIPFKGSRKKLNENQVYEIRKRVANDDYETYSSLGEEYGVASTTISNIVNGYKWEHVGFPGSSD
jgi:transposase